MKRNRSLTPSFAAGLAALALAVCLAPPLAAGELSPQLQPFAPFVGKTWKGVFSSSTPEKPVVDVSRWEAALGGRAVRIVHSLNDGEYGGETLIFWDQELESLAYFYLTTAGFYTQGTLTFEGTKFITREAVSGNADGITEVKSVGELLPDGRMQSSAQYLKNGEWVPGHSAIYAEDPSAAVVFR